MTDNPSVEDRPLTDEQRRLKARFQRDVGYWSEGLEAWLRYDTDFFELFTDFASHPRKGDGIDPKTTALVSIALVANVSYLDRDRIRVHVDAAFEQGVSFREIREVFQLVSGLGAHTLIEIAPIIRAELGMPENLSAEQLAKRDEVRELFRDNRGYWSDFWETVVQMDPTYLELYTNLTSYPWNEGVLSPKTREFVYIAVDATTTHLYTTGLEAHVQNAIALGATRTELFELAALISTIGIDTMATGMPVLFDEARKHGQLPSQMG